MVPIQIENLSYTYPSRDIPTLYGINAEISSSDLLLLTGPTGCGKTTLLRTINGLIPHAASGKLTGAVHVNGKLVATQSLSTTCQQVSLLFQNPDDQLFCTHAEDEIAFGLENLGFPPDEIRQRITSALEQVGLTGFENRRISELSGGEKQRVALAALCAMKTQVLLLDEPTSHLDPRATSDILSIVKQLNTETGMTIVIATHQVKQVAHLCNRVWLMDKGNICLDLPISDALQEDSVFRRLGVQIPEKVNSKINTTTKPTDTPPRSDPILTIRDLKYQYPNSDDLAVNDVSCDISRGEIISIMGANGSGKTTLLHLIAGLLKPTTGVVMIEGKPMKRLKLHQLAGKIGIVFQNPDLLLQAKTVREEIAFGPKNLKLKSQALIDRVDKTVNQFNLEELTEDSPYSLSRGQRQRVAVASTFSLHPDVFLLDEPTTGQDEQHLHRMMDQLCHQILQENKTLIFATHNIELSNKYANRVLLLNGGEVYYDGIPTNAAVDPPYLP